MAMSNEEHLRGIDDSVAHSARIYDWWLGGKNNFPADRELGQKIVDMVPMTSESARANRAFLHRAARAAAEAGVRQFLDLGAGLPTMDNTHTVVQRINPDNRVVYVDYDPIVLTHARALLTGVGPTTVIQADIRDPEALLGRAEVREFIDFSEPVCVLVVGVMHFMTEKDDPYSIVQRLRQDMVPGSQLVLSHITADGVPGAADVFSEMRSRMADPPTPRSHAEVLRFFEGFELLDPGVVPVHTWRPDNESETSTQGGTYASDEFWMYAGAGRL